MTKAQINHISKKLNAKSAHSFIGPNNTTLTSFLLEDEHYICVETSHLPSKERKEQQLPKYYVGINFSHMFGHDNFKDVNEEINEILEYYEEDKLSMLTYNHIN